MDHKENIGQSAALPDLFLRPDGTRVSSAEQWEEQRDYLKELLARNLYGSLPPAPDSVSGVVTESEPLYNGSAVREKVTLSCGDKITFEILVTRRSEAGRFPMILLNSGSLAGLSAQHKAAYGLDPDREYTLLPCPVEEGLLKRGFGIVQTDNLQLAPDNHLEPGQVRQAFADMELKTIAIWAWGQLRAIDYLAATDYCDMSGIVVTGHSRYGKTALCAGIYDDRIKVCAPMGSGCGGAGCGRVFGGRDGEGSGFQETIGSIITMFPHWLSDNLREFCRSDSFGLDALLAEYRNAHGDEFMQTDFNRYLMERYSPEDGKNLPFDQHMAKALIAPRYLLTCDGLDDEWANPYGTYVTWLASLEAFRFLNAGQNSAIVFREGGHTFSAEDWRCLLDFASAALSGKSTADMSKPFYENGERHFNWKRP